MIAPHPRSEKVPAARRQTVPQPAVRFASCEIGNKPTEAEQWGKARAGQMKSPRKSGAETSNIKIVFEKSRCGVIRSGFFPCCFLFDMFPDKAIPLPPRSGLQHFQQQLLRFLFS